MSCTDTLTYAVSLKAYKPGLSLTQVPPTAPMAQGQAARWAGEVRQWDQRGPGQWPKCLFQQSQMLLGDFYALGCPTLLPSGKYSSMNTATLGLQTFRTELEQQQRKFRSYTRKLEYIYITVIKPMVGGAWPHFWLVCNWKQQSRSWNDVI